jgi:hypothetical protein
MSEAPIFRTQKSVVKTDVMTDPYLSCNSLEYIASHFYEARCVGYVSRSNTMHMNRPNIPTWIDKGRVFVVDLPSLIEGNYSNL